MKIIEKIEIKNFRSFGNRKKDKIEISKIEHLNIFSGANDSGKSNILRALNLFFNKQTDSNTFFNFNNDYFKKENKDNNDIKEELVTIRITFLNEKNKGLNKKNISKIYLPEKFWVSRKWKKSSSFSDFTQSNGVETMFQKEKGGKLPIFYEGSKLKSDIQDNLSKQLTLFLDSIQFHYIPAIKDKNYFSHLYGEMQQTLLKVEKSTVNKTKEVFEKSIQDNTNSLMDDFKKIVDNKNLNISPVFELPDLLNLFRTLNVQTGEVNLLSRGDGIQAKLIPEILNFISIKEQGFKQSHLKKGEKSKKYFIWGFEEPENSYEYKNAQLLANRFKDVFYENAQIFITTHSFNFLSIEGSNISTYRVIKDNTIGSSRIKKIINNNGQYGFEGKEYLTDDEYDLNEELGIFQLNKDLEKVFIETEKIKNEAKKYKKELKDQFDSINNLKPEKVFLFEDKKGEKIWKYFFEKFGITNIKLISTEGSTKFDWEDWFIKTCNLDSSYNPKIFRQNDRDGLDDTRIKYIEENLNEKYSKINYKFLHLPVNEIENFYILKDGFFTDELINSNKDILEDNFFSTAEAKFNEYKNKYKGTDLFKDRTTSKILNQCKRESDINIKKYYPGKDIKKLKDNLNTDKEFLKWELNNFPQELVEYLVKIKHFFEH